MLQRFSGAVRVAIVGSGPGGFYSAKYLLRARPDVEVCLIDRWPSPFGLVRFGVAPDHPEVKSVQNDFTTVAASERLAFAGNVVVGSGNDARAFCGGDGAPEPAVASVAGLRSAFDAVIMACGARGERALSVPGADLDGVASARDFVKWYNAEPGAPPPPLPASKSDGPFRAVIIGHGNVALDCARVLAAPAAHLAGTDAAPGARAALAALPEERRIAIVGRRGATQAAFTIKECREFTQLGDSVELVVDGDELAAGDTAASAEEASRPTTRKRKFLDGAAAADRTGAPRTVGLRFLRSPVGFEAGPDGRLAGVRLERTALDGPAFSQRAVPTGDVEVVPCDLALYAVGYVATPPAILDGADAGDAGGAAGGYAHEGGRVLGERGLYCAGWCKRGPSGIVGTNVADARETVAAVLADLEGRTETAAVSAVDDALLAPAATTSWADWRAIDAAEVAAAGNSGAPRVKLDTVRAMVDAARAADR